MSKNNIITQVKNTWQNKPRPVIPEWLNIVINQAALWFYYIGVTVVMSVIVYKVMQYGGLAGFIGTIMAYNCDPSECNFNSSISIVAIVIFTLTALFIYTVKAGTNTLNKMNYHEIPAALTAPTYQNTEKEKAYQYLVALGGIDNISNLKELAAWLDIPYTTLYRYVKEFELDGHIAIVSNGAGIPMEIRIK